MEIKLIDYNPNALDVLLYTKNTRLDGAESLDDIKRWPMSKKLDHLDYMLKTIQSSWEFVTYIFEIKNVSRVFTHQLVRTRTASFAQQSQRTVEAKSTTIGPDLMIFKDAADSAHLSYQAMIEKDIAIQDARYILPEGTITNIIMKVDLRTLSHMAEVRLCYRTGGEYQNIFKEMKRKIGEVHPWAEQFLKVKCVKDGICAFPNYTECPIQQYTIMTDKNWLKRIESAWENTEHVANPKAKDGKTMQ